MWIQTLHSAPCSRTPPSRHALFCANLQNPAPIPSGQVVDWIWNMIAADWLIIIKFNWVKTCREGCSPYPSWPTCLPNKSRDLMIETDSHLLGEALKFVQMPQIQKINIISRITNRTCNSTWPRTQRIALNWRHLHTDCWNPDEVWLTVLRKTDYMLWQVTWIITMHQCTKKHHAISLIITPIQCDLAPSTRHK